MHSARPSGNGPCSHGYIGNIHIYIHVAVGYEMCMISRKSVHRLIAMVVQH